MIELLALSLGLATDAFAVSLVRGSTGERRMLRALEIGVAFGTAQGLMPLVGWGLGVAFAGAIEAFDHWIAFGLLVAIGAKMLWESLSGGEDERPPAGRGHRVSLAIAALATSIDAAAAGIALPLLSTSLTTSCVTIGATTAVLCAGGYWFGGRVPPQRGKAAEVVGGLVLIALGVKILIEHTAG